jgi:iron complex transport system substrate-binding protein
MYGHPNISLVIQDLMTQNLLRTLAGTGTALLLAAAAADAAPRRVVALTPFTANTAARIGLKPIAIGQTLGGQDRFAPELAGVPRLALSHPSGPNIEQLAARNPQLVLSAPVWRKGHAAMRRLKMRVVASEPRRVGEVATQTRRIGQVLGRPATANRRASLITRRIARITKGIRKRPTVLLVLGVGRTSYAMLANSWGGDVVRRSGGRLLTAGLRAGDGYARISDEAVVARDPDIIIAVPHGESKNYAKQAAYLRNKAGWRTTRAARSGRIHVATGNSLLQPYDDVHLTIRDVRKLFLKNL